LKQLHALSVYDELKQYTVKHSLYREAMELYKYQPENLREITHLYADYLYQQNNYKEAAIGKSKVYVKRRKGTTLLTCKKKI
jgi:elongator complex protein 1